MNDNNNVDYWNNLYAKDYFFGSGPTKLAKLAESILHNSNCKKILEVGCGQGRDATYFSQLGYDVEAFDISENAIKFIHQKKRILNLANLNVLVHDVEKPFPYAANFFDFVYSNLALQFFNENKLDQIFQNIHENMKKNSQFLFSTKKQGDKYYQFGNEINKNAYEHKGIVRYFYDEKTLKELLSNYFSILSFEYDSHTNQDKTISVWWKILLKK